MRRFLLCLPVCMLLAPAPTVSPSTSFQPRAELLLDGQDTAVPDRRAMERLAAEQPLVFLEHCLRRCRGEVHGYRARLLKHERIAGQLRPEEEIDFTFKESPYSVLMNWRKGAGLAQCVLYVEGGNDGKLLVQPAGLARFVGVLSRDPDGPEARKTGRYSIKESGLRDGIERTLRDWKAAHALRNLTVDYLGVQEVPEVGGRPCYTLRRRCASPEEDGFTEVLLHIDIENWLQVGSVMTGPEGLYGAYYFRDIELNPIFPADQFERAALTKP
jgi:hypothetical protein